jgi:hypothetical protein
MVQKPALTLLASIGRRDVDPTGSLPVMRLTSGACSSSAPGINPVSSPLRWGEGGESSDPGEGFQYWRLRLTTPFSDLILCFYRHSRFVRSILQSRG